MSHFWHKGLLSAVSHSGENFKKIGEGMYFEFIIAAASDARSFALTRCKRYSITEFLQEKVKEAAKKQFIDDGKGTAEDYYKTKKNEVFKQAESHAAKMEAIWPQGAQDGMGRTIGKDKKKLLFISAQPTAKF